MKYQISIKGSATKPTSTEFGKIKWLEEETDLPTLIEYLEKGHTYRANMDNTLNGGQKTFVSTQIVMIDVDGKHNPPTLSQFLEQTQLIPTFYYETFSSQNGERYRLGYMLNKEIKSKAEYNAIAHIIVERTGCLNKEMVDSVSFSALQNIAGTNKPVINNSIAYNKSDFDRLIDAYLPKV